MSEEQNKKSEDRIQNEELKKEESEQHFPEDIHAPKQPSTENMEIHAHELHKAPGHGWKHYLFEFFMLFLAVFAGFLAENWREHSVERSREKQYIRLLLDDLKSDTSFYQSQKQKLLKKQPDFDSLFRLLTQLKPASNQKILEKFLPLGYTYNFEITSTTYNQMKSSGSLRYIENEDLLRNLQSYYEIFIPKAESLNNDNNEFMRQYILPYYMNHVRSQDWDFKTDSLISSSPVIMNRDQQSDQQLANSVWNYGHLLEAFVRIRLIPCEKKAEELSELIKKEYRIR